MLILNNVYIQCLYKKKKKRATRKDMSQNELSNSHKTCKQNKMQQYLRQVI